MATLKKQAKSLTIKASVSQILIGIGGGVLAVDQLIMLVDHAAPMLPPVWVAKIRIGLAVAQIGLGFLAWYGRARIMQIPPAETPVEEKL